MKFEQGQKMLITTDNYFFAPDGRQYRAAFGVCKGVQDSDQSLGIKANRGSSNWYILLGDLLIAGCQIHYAIATENVHLGPTNEYTFHEGVKMPYTCPSQVYYAGGEE